MKALRSLSRLKSFSINSSVLLLYTFISLTAFGERLVIDINGVNGVAPIDGDCCEYLPKTRSHMETPKRGDNAKPGGPGGNANNLNIKLKDSGSLNGSLVVYGLVKDASNGSVRSRIDKEISLTSSIIINAVGGAGARGGRGGQGQDGCDGDNGADATSSRRGQDGEDGCNSGGGGDASAAQRGGSGGQVKVYIPAEQTHLALLVNVDISGGKGGAPGVPGQPGRPGQGGRGGDSHTYIDHYDKEPDCPSSSGGGYGGSSGGGYGGGSSGGGASNLGNGYDAFESDASPYILDDLKRTAQVAGDVLNELIGVSPAYACGGRTPVYETSPGGRNGSSGQSGPVGGGVLTQGKNGDEGSLEFIVVEPNGRETSYRKPFDLQILGYDISDSAPGGNEDGIFEPNEILTISRIRVKNQSPMPSPKMADVILSIQTSNWIIANPIDKVILPSLKGNQEIVLKDIFKVKVKSSFNVGVNEAWRVTDSIVPLGDIPRIQRTQSGLSLPKTVAISYPVEITPLQSVAIIGPGETASVQWRVTNVSNRDFIGLNGAVRKLQTTLARVSGDAPANTITKINIKENEQSDNKVFLRTITKLRKRESIIISGEINFSKESEPYTSVDLEATLGLEILGSSKMTPILTQSHRFTISQTYNYTGASVLLLTNSNTNREEYRAWLNLFKDLGLKADVWDMSYNGELNLVKDLNSSEKGKSLIENYSGKTVVLLNNTLPDSGKLRSIKMLSHSQFYQAALENKINFYIVGGEKEDLISEVVGMHLNPNLLSPTAENKEKFIAAIESNQVLNNSISLDNADEKTYFEIHQKLRQRPDLNYSLLYMGQRKETKLALLPSLSQLAGRLIAQPVSLRESTSKHFIDSSQNLRPFLLSLSSENKARIFLHLVHVENKKYISDVTSTLIHDLIEASYTYSVLKGKKEQEEALAKIRSLNLIINAKINNATFESDIGRMVAALSYFASVSKNQNLKTEADKLIKKLDSEALSSYKTYYKAFEDFSHKREKALKANYDATFDVYKMFTLPAIGKAITSGNTLFVKSQFLFKGGLK